MSLSTLVLPFLELKADDAEPGVFTGYGSTFGNVDLGKDVCAKGCFKRSLEEMVGKGQQPAMYWMHDRKEPIGDWLEVREDSKGLVVKGRLWTGEKATECSKKAYNMLRGTGSKGLSIGYITKQSTYDDKKGVRTLTDVDLPEVSVVGYGMNPKALVTSIKSHIADGLLPTVRDIEDILRDAGLSAAQAKSILAEGYQGLRRDDAPEIPDSEAKALLDLFKVTTHQP